MLQLVIILSLHVLLISCSNNDEIKGGKTVSQSGQLIQGDGIATALLHKQYEQLYDQFSSSLQSIVTLKDFETLSDEFTKGEETFIVVSSSELNGYHTYIWHSQSKEKGIFAAVNSEHIIEAFQVIFLTPHPDTDNLYSEVNYQLPFNDEWYVYWGGKDILSNYHYEHEHIRYAYDFVKVVDGFSYHGDPLKNENYYAFDQDVVAPAKGIVVSVVDGIEDNIPGVINEAHPEGNMVIIEHEHGEFSMLAHFKQHSIVVKVGDEVEAGQLLGKTGNSGYSSEAHIHYQVNKIMDDGRELVIPITFNNGQEWAKGDLAKNN